MHLRDLRALSTKALVREIDRRVEEEHDVQAARALHKPLPSPKKEKTRGSR